jgi:hypothetical protein
VFGPYFGAGATGVGAGATGLAGVFGPYFGAGATGLAGVFGPYLVGGGIAAFPPWEVVNGV